MKDTLILEGKNYISARRAAKIINYAQDYIGQLCRSEKLDCKMVGRSWFVTEESLLNHRENAIDATQERITKISKKPEEIIKEIIKKNIQSVAARLEQPVAIAVADTESSYKYETAKGPSLPALEKRVPSVFSQPGPLVKVYPVAKAYLAYDFKKDISGMEMSVVILVLAIATGSFIFSPTLSSTISHLSSTTSESSIFTAMRNFFGSAGRTLNNSGVPSSTPAPVTSTYNGIGVIPSSQSVATDDMEKAKIRNSFSDEVTIRPDQSGTAGIITPVFKKTTGDSFVYVLVPVKDNQQETKQGKNTK